ncbi:glycosyltransferase family A protein [Reinekea marinisedimentorum]|uniref:Glycosyltransferase 2-like domain-containing protein n=1 Tax=Reinekea marinisedimentorum TaxID=230495 RepID=A0A4R3I979_9GAMM|nr:glycosyltransferase family A protein [Reinekea marinisedimentorum]TCS41920.1 hypothetical protein BCF53_10424 [Reinekea marinisedimentorum]
MKLKEFFQFIPAAIKLRSVSLESLNDVSKPALPVVISLTSIPSRLPIIHYTIRSVLTQSYRPEKMLLWLNESLRNEIPKRLKELEGDIFEIRFSKLDCPHLKLVETLAEFQQSNIVTCDDDLIYPNDWLELLYNEHKAFPDQIIANTCRYVMYDEQGNTLPYVQWSNNIPYGTSSLAIMPAGYGGVLYPPGSLLTPEVYSSDIYLKLSPKADDLWFKAMSFLNGTVCRRSAVVSERAIPVAGSRKVTLSRANVNQDKNREQWNALRAYYNFKTPCPESLTK